MNVGIDIDATITEIPWLFSIISKGLRKAGHRVFIVSYRSIDDLRCTKSDLRNFDIDYDELCLSDDDGESIGEFKSRIAREKKLDVFFDDLPEALIDMPEYTKTIWICDRSFYDLELYMRLNDGGNWLSVD